MLIDDDSGYQYRSMHTELYTQKQVRLGGEKAYLFTKIDKTEASLFWPHKGMNLNLSISSNDPKGVATSTMDQVMPTVRWIN